MMLKSWRPSQHRDSTMFNTYAKGFEILPLVVQTPFKQLECRCGWVGAACETYVELTGGFSNHQGERRYYSYTCIKCYSRIFKWAVEVQK